VPEGRACGNCEFFVESRRRGDEAWCSRWDDWARGDYYCDAWKKRGGEEEKEEGEGRAGEGRFDGLVGALKGFVD